MSHSRASSRRGQGTIVLRALLLLGHTRRVVLACSEVLAAEVSLCTGIPSVPTPSPPSVLRCAVVPVTPSKTLSVSHASLLQFFACLCSGFFFCRSCLCLGITISSCRPAFFQQPFFSPGLFGGYTGLGRFKLRHPIDPESLSVGSIAIQGLCKGDWKRPGRGV